MNYIVLYLDKSDWSDELTYSYAKVKYVHPKDGYLQVYQTEESMKANFPELLIPNRLVINVNKIEGVN